MEVQTSSRKYGLAIKFFQNGKECGSIEPVLEQWLIGVLEPFKPDHLEKSSPFLSTITAPYCDNVETWD